MFFRPARKEDFEGFEIQYDHGRYMSDEVKLLIEKDNYREAVRRFKVETGLGIYTSNEYCDKYQKYVFAKRDFEEGKEVFIPY